MVGGWTLDVDADWNREAVNLISGMAQPSRDYERHRSEAQYAEVAGGRGETYGGYAGGGYEADYDVSYGVSYDMGDYAGAYAERVDAYAERMAGVERAMEADIAACHLDWWG